MLTFPFQLFLKKTEKAEKIACYCRHCKAKLVYFKGEGCWDLMEQMTAHNHSSTGRRIKRKAEDIDKVKEFMLLNFDTLPSRKKLFPAIWQIFRLPRPTFYKLYNRVLSEKNRTTFGEMVQSLQRSYDISFHPEDLEDVIYPEVLFITNDQMRENFNNFGESVSFDLTFSLFKEQRVTKITRKKAYRLKKGKMVEEEIFESSESERIIEESQQEVENLDDLIELSLSSSYNNNSNDEKLS